MTRRKKTDWAGIVVVLSLTLTPLTARADIRDILLKFHPSVSVEEEYNNNIDLTAKNKIEDFITTISPGVRFSALSEKKYGLDLDYLLGLVFYAKETENNYVSHAGTMNFWYALSPKLTVRLREYLVRSEEPREREYTQGALPEQLLLGTQRNRSVYLRNVVEPSLEYQFGREDRISINYRNNIYNTQDPSSEDSQENFIGSNLIYWFNVKNGISLNYGFTRGSFDQSPDFTRHSAEGRYTYRFSPRTSIFGDFLFEKQDFKSTGIPDQSSSNYDVYRPSLGMEYAFSPTLSGSVQLGYFWQKPDRGPSTSDPYYNLSLSQRGQKTTYTFAFQGGYTEDFFTAQNRGFTKYDRLIGTVTHQLQERISVGGYSSFELSESSRPDQKDRIWRIGASGSYQLLKWMSVALDVSHQEDHSNIAEGDYSEYRAVFRVTASY